jgi:hypothetical protein
MIVSVLATPSIRDHFFRCLLALLIQAVVFEASGAEIEQNAKPPIVIAPEAVDGISAAIWLLDGSSKLPSNKPLVYAFGLMESNPPVRLLVLKQEYFCRVTLVDSEGVAVKKSQLGERLGSRFSEVAEYSRDLLVINHKDVPKLASAFPGFGGAQNLRVDGRTKVTPDDLFLIKEKGNYSLQIQFQTFRTSSDDTNPRPRLLFPPITVPVEKD